MKRCWLFVIVAALFLPLFLCPTARGVELGKFDRTVRNEPVYATKVPKYCLVAFGLEGKTRRWLVLDGNTLYVDKKGDGDFSGAAKVGLNKKNTRFEPFTVKDGAVDYIVKVWVWKNGRVQVFASRKGDYPKRVKWGKDEQWIFGGPNDISGRSWTNEPGVEVAEHDLQFAERSQDAPVVHFDGPLTLKVMDVNLAFVRGDKPNPLHVMVGTPGVGRCTFTQILFYPGDPDAQAEIVFPPRDPTAKPIVLNVPVHPPG